MTLRIIEFMGLSHRLIFRTECSVSVLTSQSNLDCEFFGRFNKPNQASRIVNDEAKGREKSQACAPISAVRKPRSAAIRTDDISET